MTASLISITPYSFLQAAAAYTVTLFVHSIATPFIQ